MPDRMMNRRISNIKPISSTEMKNVIKYEVSEEELSPSAVELSRKEVIRAAIIHNSGFNLNSKEAVKTITEKKKSIS
jgi:hypothetical protein